MTVRRRVVVSGRVQGVWFRESCRRRAEDLGVTGWVRNLPSGQVEAVFEGPPSAVEAMVDWSRDGPPQARVEGLEVVDEPDEGLDSFRVR